jgi:transcription antitermination factor NusB
MSFEKEGKSSGTRRKARECALQMLFAADVVNAGDLSLIVNYWGELGFDEVHHGAVQLVASFSEQAEKLQKTASEIRTWLKRNEPYEKTTSRSEKAKEFGAAVETLLTQYRGFIRQVVEEKAINANPVHEQLRQIEGLHARLIADIGSTIETNRLRISSEDKSQLNEFRSQPPSIFNKMSRDILPQVEKMAESVVQTRAFADRLASGSINNLETIDERIRTRAEHWRIERMAIVDRNVLRLAVYEFLHEDTPHTVVINEALEIARRFSTFEATQFINGILDAIKLDLEKNGDRISGGTDSEGVSKASSS